MYVSHNEVFKGLLAKMTLLKIYIYVYIFIRGLSEDITLCCMAIHEHQIILINT